MIYICIGSGGVGKTTFSSALAFYLAQQGKNVLVLTIDPSMRLKTTMGLSDNEFKEIKDSSFKGSLHASVINHQKTFNEFLMKVGNPKIIEKIISNRLYQQLSTTLSGSQDFTALEKLLSAYESKKYDAIVLDTPPAQHAIEFLKSPQRLSKIFSDSIAKWFRSEDKGFIGLNYLRKAMSMGTKQILIALEKLT
jgi:anion-transporting  ArsA/GET3 family ATPase